MLRRCLCVAALALGCSSSGDTRPPVLADAGVTDLGSDTGPTDTGAPDASDAGSVTDASDAGALVDVTDASDVVTVDASDANDVVDAGSLVDVIDAGPTVDATDAGPTVDVVDAGSPEDVTDAGLTDASAIDAPVIDGGFGAWRPIPGGESCNARERAVPVQAAPHVDPDAGPIDWITNPPASGPHFPNWARFGAFPDIPRGNWVHNLEHGGVVFLYRCAADGGACAEARDALVSAAAGIPEDPACNVDAGDPRIRVVITNDGQIETPIAGAAWGWLYAADCVEPTSVRTFFARHVGMATEDFCFDGFVP